MEEKTFTLTHSSPIIIYGCGYWGRKIANELISKNYNVIAFVDKKASSIISYENIPVISINELVKIDKIEECILLVMLNNGMSHKQVVSELYNYGIVNILYCPMQIEYSYEKRRAMRKIYNYCMKYEFELVKNVPKFQLSDNNIEKTKIIDISASNKISFWCPIEYLKEASVAIINAVGEEYKDEMLPEKLKYQECNIENAAYNNLYKWLKGEKVNIDDYLRRVGRSSKEKRIKWLEERKELYQIYLDALKHDLTFFTDAPSTFVWNSNGYLNITDGTTRAHFLISEGYNEIPICVSMEDYDAWKIYIAHKREE